MSRQPGAYDEADLEMLANLGAQASIAITNANLMSQLASSRADISSPSRRCAPSMALVIDHRS